MGLKKALIAGVFVALNSSAYAQVSAGTTIDCVFSQRHTMVLENGRLAIANDNSKDLLVTFTAFKLKERVASLVGNSGSAEIFFHEDEDTLILVQLLGGAIKTMTSMTLPPPGQTVIAIHSRQVWFPGTEGGVFSQWAGPCRTR